MKRSKLLIFLSVLAMQFPSLAQNGNAIVSPNNLNQPVWQNAILRSDGQTVLNNVEAYCLKTTCDGEEFILIKFVNKNDFKVSVEWVNAIFVNGVWYYSKNPNPRKLYLNPGDTFGQCDGIEKLKVKVNSIIDNPSAFEHFTVSGLVINK